MDDFANSPILSRRSMDQFLEWYKPFDSADITVSPLLATDFRDVPPAFFQICGRDPLRDEGLAYADKLEEHK
jgi:acetyl esterase/lipase